MSGESLYYVVDAALSELDYARKRATEAKDRLEITKRECLARLGWVEQPSSLWRGPLGSDVGLLTVDEALAAVRSAFVLLTDRAAKHAVKPDDSPGDLS